MKKSDYSHDYYEAAAKIKEHDPAASALAAWELNKPATTQLLVPRFRLSRKDLREK